MLRSLSWEEVGPGFESMSKGLLLVPEGTLCLCHCQLRKFDPQFSPGCPQGLGAQGLSQCSRAKLTLRSGEDRTLPNISALGCP